MRWHNGFLHLQKQRIVVAIPEQKCQVGACPNTTHTNDTMDNVDNVIAAQHECQARGIRYRRPLRRLENTLGNPLVFLQL